MRSVSAALLHFPVLDRKREVVTTAITNLDLHDMARSAHTFDLGSVFIVHPIAAQRELALRVRRHWVDGAGARRIPDRKPALALLEVVASLEEALGTLGVPVELWATSASGPGDLSHADARALLQEPGPSVMVLFGTGWGLAEQVMDMADRRLAPIESPRADGYNHLSVRSAAAILFDRLVGVR